LPVKKKTFSTAAFISAFLLSAVAGIQLVNLGRANPFSQSAYSGEMIPPASATPPSIAILLPVNNGTCDKDFVILRLDAVVGQAPNSFPSYVFHGLALSKLCFRADWLENETEVNGSSEFSYVYNSSGTSENFYDNFYGRTTGSYSCDLRLEGIPDGNHIITVDATERGYYYYVQGGVSFHYYGYSISAVSSVNFTVDTVPIVSFLSFENTTIDVSDVPLNFTVNQVVSKITYCLDGQENVTISGNTTLAGLPNGKHNITIYAMDETGNIGASKTITFTVASESPSESTLELFPAVPVAAVSGTLAVVVAAAVFLVHFGKRQKRSEDNG
jgi:hypothetical protein